MPELLARVRALLRRTGRLESAVHQIDDLIVDEAARSAHRGGHDVELTPIEFDLLVHLVRQPGRALSKERLLSLVWGSDEYAVNVVEVHVSALRRKLEVHGPRLVHTVRGAGYLARAG
jgi:DNA-binding response OmpR family regulator